MGSLCKPPHFFVLAKMNEGSIVLVEIRLMAACTEYST
jgi:hypothetical protein